MTNSFASVTAVLLGNAVALVAASPGVFSFESEPGS